MKTWKKVLIGITAAVVLLIIVGATVAGSRKGIVTVQTGKVVRQDISSVVTASGEIKPKTYVNVGANAFGKITHLYVKEGALVKKGQLLAQLENVQSSADLAATRASVGASETDYVAADAAYKTSAADVLDKTTYAAPFDGIVTNLPVREGETVVIGIQNSPGSTLMTVADMSVITAEVRVDETDIVNVRLGQSADVTIDAFPRQTFKAVVTKTGVKAAVCSTALPD